jgi:hypothetical protein
MDPKMGGSTATLNAGMTLNGEARSFYRALREGQAGDYSAALSSLNGATARSALADAYYVQGEIEFLKGDVSKATADWTNVLNQRDAHLPGNYYPDKVHLAALERLAVGCRETR